MGQVVLSSTNTGNLKELAALLGQFSVALVAQESYAVESVAETGLSFVENALIKARHACRMTGLPAIADDSGICVDALQGQPGIYSARYAGATASDADNVVKLLGALKAVPREQRTARFECAIVYLDYSDDPTPTVCTGSWQGEILHEPRGTNGFGYDPVFFVSEMGCTSAEVDTAIKNRLSHRGQAIRQLVERLQERLGNAHRM